MTTGVIITLVICSTVFAMYLVTSVTELIRDIKFKDDEEDQNGN